LTSEFVVEWQVADDCALDRWALASAGPDREK
jgi:hypothetical protein